MCGVRLITFASPFIVPGHYCLPGRRPPTTPYGGLVNTRG